MTGFKQVTCIRKKKIKSCMESFIFLVIEQLFKKYLITIIRHAFSNDK